MDLSELPYPNETGVEFISSYLLGVIISTKVMRVESNTFSDPLIYKDLQN